MSEPAGSPQGRTPEREGRGPARQAAGNEVFAPLTAQSRELLEACFEEFAPTLERGVKAAIDGASRAFDHKSMVSDQEIADFLGRRGEFMTMYASNLPKLFGAWLAGKRRTDRRPDINASPAALSVLSDIDYAMQETLTKAIGDLRRTTRDSVFALDARVACLIGEDDSRRMDNPFSIDYLLDAIGMSLRARFPNPRIHRAVMKHVVGSIADEVNKRYIALNRFLASKDILPGAEANVRARSELRPDDDRDLLMLFNKLLTAPGKPEAPPPELADAIEVPEDLVDFAEPVRAAGRGGHAAAGNEVIDQFSDPAALFRALGRGMQQSAPAKPGAAVADAPAAAPLMIPALTLPSPEVTNAILAAFARYVQPLNQAHAQATAVNSAEASGPAGAGARSGAGSSLSPVSAAGNGEWIAQAAALHGGSDLALPATATPLTHAAEAMIAWPSPMVALLDQWQRFDPTAESAWSGASAPASPRPTVPLNRIPIIRAALADQIVDPLDGVTMDVMTLLFDYVFRDPSIPESMRSLFANLQVPIAKAALLDRSFFADKRHAARLLLDDLAAAAVGAHNNPVYLLSLQALAQSIIANVCRDFNTDVGVFAAAGATLQEWVVAEHEDVAAACAGEVAAALADEESNLHMVPVRALVGEKLTGQAIPFEVEAFVETIWTDFLAKLHAQPGPQSDEWRDALQTLDDLLWSLTSKDAAGQRARMGALIPVLIRKLRAGCAEVNADRERASGFFDVLYRHHIGALKPNSEAAILAGETTPVVAANDEPWGASTGGRRFNIVNLHDFVSDMAVGTWLTFRRNTEKIFARLFWISPKRSKFVFTTRSKSLALIMTPEELAWELGTDRATLVIEPVPMYDRAINAALDTLAANQDYTTITKH
ncbi:MAG: DUF1631 family protein [Casimicrobiaceae bacterium]